MTDEQKDPAERERDEDLEMDAEQAEDVKGGLGFKTGASALPHKLDSLGSAAVGAATPAIKLDKGIASKIRPDGLG
jgi:hypothetical protein